MKQLQLYLACHLSAIHTIQSRMFSSLNTYDWVLFVTDKILRDNSLVKNSDIWIVIWRFRHTLVNGQCWGLGETFLLWSWITGLTIYFSVLTQLFCCKKSNFRSTTNQSSPGWSDLEQLFDVATIILFSCSKEPHVSNFNSEIQECNWMW